MSNSDVVTLPSKLYLAEQIKKNEADCAHSVGVDLYQLMEKAGHAVFDCIMARFPTAQHILVIAGRGNNGGDAYVVGRLAIQSGMNVTLLAKDAGGEISADASVARHGFVSAGGVILDLQCHWPKIETLDVDLIIDGLIGIGLKQDLDVFATNVVRAVNKNEGAVISIDVPSGLDSDTGKQRGLAIVADYTVSFIALKPGFFTADGPDCIGQLIYSDLGLRKAFENQVASHISLIHRQNITAIQTRPFNSHKGSYGTVLIIGGASGMGGAAYLAGKSALRSGVGKVHVFCESGNESLITQLCPELMVRGLDVSGIKGELNTIIDQVDCIVVGPGLGKAEWSKTVMSEVFNNNSLPSKPVIFDADAINYCAKALNQGDEKLQSLLNKKDKPWVFTPHPLEASRLLNIKVANIERDRLLATTQLIKKLGSAVVLKGKGSIVGTGHIDIVRAINLTGNPGMATAGMGDVLTGVIAACFTAWGLGHKSVQKKLELAVYLHGLAGDFTAKETKIGMIATDVIESLPGAICDCLEVQ